MAVIFFNFPIWWNLCTDSFHYKLLLLAQLFSEKTQGIPIALASSLSAAAACKKFCNISVITEEIFLETQSMRSLSKKQSILSRETIQNAFSELCPFFDLDSFLSIKHPTAGRWHSHKVPLLQT